MLLASAALLAVVVAGVMVVVTAGRLERARAALYDVRRRELRYRAWVAERERFRQSRKAIADAAQSTAQMHQAIAEVPFGILGAIPPTSATSKLLRRIHDGIASAVYGALGGKVTPQDEAGSAPPERPTPPELPHD